MSSSYPVLTSRPIVPHISSSCSQCHSHLEFPVPAPIPRPATLLQVRCFKCQSIISHTFYPAQMPGGGASGSTNNHSSNGSNSRSSQSQAARKGRKIGTQDRPLETGYYDILGCSGMCCFMYLQPGISAECLFQSMLLPKISRRRIVRSWVFSRERILMLGLKIRRSACN
jgi:hypothetical protein